MQVCLIQGKAEAVSTDSGEGRGTEVLPGGLKSVPPYLSQGPGAAREQHHGEDPRGYC